MVKAYLSQKNDPAVPVDVIEIKEYSDQKALILPEGNYNLKICNIKGDSLSINAVIESKP